MGEALEKINVPLYFQLEHIIRSKILMGDFVPGGQIPTEKDFSNIYHVSTITVRQAILNLVNEGLLTRRQGRGTFVSEGLTNPKTIKTFQIVGDINDIIPEGIRKQEAKVLEIRKIKTPIKVGEVLNIEESTEVTQIRRTRSDNKIPISYVVNYLPVEIGEKINEKDLNKFPMLYLLRNRLGIPLRYGTQSIEAIVADYDVASALSISIGSPVLYLETTMFTNAKKPVEFVRTFYRSDLFKFILKMNLKSERRTILKGQARHARKKREEQGEEV